MYDSNNKHWGIVPVGLENVPAIKDDPLEDLSPFEFKIVREYFSGENKTISEIARKVGASPRMVSRILSLDTVKQLWKDMRQMYYQDMATANLKGAKAIHDILDSDKATNGEKLRAAQIASESTGTNKPRDLDEGAHRGKSVELSDVIGMIIAEAAAEGRRRQISEDILELNEDEDGNFK
jgi:hypothetical protein